jgi:hypothetical protein
MQLDNRWKIERFEVEMPEYVWKPRARTIEVHGELVKPIPELPQPPTDPAR